MRVNFGRKVPGMIHPTKLFPVLRGQILFEWAFGLSFLRDANIRENQEICQIVRLVFI